MPKSKNKRTVVAVYFVPGSKPTVVSDNGITLKKFKNHCYRKEFEYSGKVIKLCQDALNNYSNGKELRSLIREFGINELGLKIGGFIKVIITQYMNGLKQEEK